MILVFIFKERKEKKLPILKNQKYLNTLDII